MLHNVDVLVEEVYMQMKDPKTRNYKIEDKGYYPIKGNYYSSIFSGIKQFFKMLISIVEHVINLKYPIVEKVASNKSNF